MGNRTVTILGIRFFLGTPAAAVEQMTQHGGLLIVPAAPAFVRWRGDPVYRDATASADLAIPDSGLMVLCWRILRRVHIPRISGLAYTKALIACPSFQQFDDTIFVLPNDTAKEKLLSWARNSGRRLDPGNFYIAPMYDGAAQDPSLLQLIEKAQPRHVVIAIGNGPQEKLGYFLRENLFAGPGSARLAIHCIGAALGFLTGEQVAIPTWADRFYLGWLFRLFAQPRIFIPRLARALALPWLIFRYGERMPPGKLESRI